MKLREHTTLVAGSLMVLIGFVLLLGGCGGENPTPRPVATAAPDRTGPSTMDAALNSGVQFLGGPLAERMIARERPIESSAIEALSRIGTPAVPSLVELLRDSDSELRRDAAQALARIGPQARAAVPELIVALGDKNDDVRQSATRALGEIGPAARDAVPALMKELRESAKQNEIDSREHAARESQSPPANPFAPAPTKAGK